MYVIVLWIGIALAGAAALGAIVFVFIRWLMGKQRRVSLPDEMLDEMTRYAERFQSIVDDMNQLFTNIEDHSRREWRRKNVEIIANLREMNRLLQQLHTFFEAEAEAVASREGRRREPAAGDREPRAHAAEEAAPLPPSTGPITDFSGPGERRKFRRMPAISGDEIESTDLDDLLDRFDEDKDAKE